jgi:hypothetical protein
MPESSSEGIDGHAASKFFLPIRKLTRRLDERVGDLPSTIQNLFRLSEAAESSAADGGWDGQPMTG